MRLIPAARAVPWVLEALRGGGINIVAIHQHMTGESPRMLFLHYLFAAAALACTTPVRAEGDRSALAAQMKGARVPLSRGLAASASKGTPISGKFEVEVGKLQLSVYTAEGTNYSEAIVDHKTGKVKESKAITSDDDLTAAKAQAEAMASAKTSLKAAVDKAVKGNKGYRAVSVTPSVEDGNATAGVMLLRGNETKIVTES